MKDRIIYRRTPGGRVTVLCKRRKPSPAKCAICGKPLQGVIREPAYWLKSEPKQRKKVSRKYGGYLCSGCARKVIAREARQMFGHLE